MEEYVGGSDEDHASQDYLLDPSQDGSPRYILGDPQGPAQDRHQDHSRQHGQDQPQDCPQRMLEVRSFQWAGLERFESAIAEPSVSTYDYDDDVQWRHTFVSGAHGVLWDDIQLLAFVTFMALLCFMGAITIWIMVT
jgi:hypothetical protein